MKTKKNSEKTSNNRINSRHQKKKGPVLVYFILFIAVSITMITLNQVRKKNIRLDTGSTEVNTKPSEFTKEGELEFLNAAGEVITKIEIEIADDDLQTQRGMMYRRTLRQDRGMLFIFPDEEERSFWMKNTLISLDILYVDAEKNIVSISENAPPKSERSIWSEYPAKYVVEVNSGFVATHQIRVGDRIRFSR